MRKKSDYPAIITFKVTRQERQAIKKTAKKRGYKEFSVFIRDICLSETKSEIKKPISIEEKIAFLVLEFELVSNGFERLSNTLLSLYKKVIENTLMLDEKLTRNEAKIKTENLIKKECPELFENGLVEAKK